MITVRVYDGASLSANASTDASGAISRARNITFTTGLPGGFLSCTWDTTLADPSAWDVELGRYVKLYASLDSVFEGQIEDIGYSRDMATGLYTASVTALGPWARAKKVREAANYVAATTGNTIVQTALAEMANISTDYTYVWGADRNLNTVNYDASVADVIEDVLKYGSQNNIPLYFAFWETPQTGTSTAGPRAWLWQRDLTTIVHWRVRVSEFAFKYTESLANVYNAVVATYNAGANETAESTDAASQALYGERQIWSGLSVETQTLAVAEAARATYISWKADPRPILSPFALKRWARDGGGVKRPCAYVRAGDVMTVEDWIVDDTSYTFVVGATTYSADEDSVQITPEERPKTLSALLGAASV